MKLIAHRGNLEGKSEFENSPLQVENALKNGFDAEVDVWYKESINAFYLGHDKPDYGVEKEFLLQEGLWCHAKDLTALIALQKIGAHCFFHDNDDAVFTSKGYLWIHGRNREYDLATDQSILLKPEVMMPINFKEEPLFREAFKLMTTTYKNFGGICSDYVKILKDG